MFHNGVSTFAAKTVWAVSAGGEGRVSNKSQHLAGKCRIMQRKGMRRGARIPMHDIQDSSWESNLRADFSQGIGSGGGQLTGLGNDDISHRQGRGHFPPDQARGERGETRNKYNHPLRAVVPAPVQGHDDNTHTLFQKHTNTHCQRERETQTHTHKHTNTHCQTHTHTHTKVSQHRIRLSQSSGGVGSILRGDAKDRRQEVQREIPLHGARHREQRWGS